MQSTTLPQRARRRIARLPRPGHPVAVAVALDAHRAALRRHLAQEMHDDVGQVLAAMNLDLAVLLHDAAGNDAVQQHVRHLQSLVETMISSVRRMVAEQPPRVLEQHGLPAAIEQLVDGFRKRHAILFPLDVALPSTALPMPVQQAVFRILQEALSNAVRHANPNIVRISLASRQGKLHLLVADDGRGADATAFDKPDSVGLAWMRKRIEALEGSMRITSVEGAGMTISVCLPYAAR